MNDNNKIVLFDGVCILCNNLVKFVIRRDKNKRIKFAPLQSNAGKKIMENHLVPASEYDSIIYFSGKNLLTKSTAVLEIFNDIGGVWKSLYVFMIVPKFIRDWIYDTIAKSRYKIFGQLNTCMIPDTVVKDRFLT